MSSYDDLLRQVESLRVENSTLQRELHDNSTHLVKLENEATSLRESLNQSQAPDGEADYSFNDELTCGEHLAVYEESNEVNDSQNLLDPVANDNSRDQGHQRSHGTEPDDLESLRQDEEHLLSLMHQYDKERTNLLQQIEAEEKNRKWYYDQIEMASRKIRSLPMNDPHSKQTQQGWTRKHLEFEISRLQETMHESFGTNELIEQRREARVQRIRQIEAELKSLQQQHREQVQRQSEVNLTKGQGHNGHLSSNSGEMDQVAMSAESNKNGLDVVDSRNPNIPAMYHGTWPIEKDDNAQGPQGHNDLASVMSFNSTNTSSSQGSGSGGQRLPQQQNLQQQQQQQQPVAQPLVPQQLGTKVEMVYGLLSMLGTHDKDDMSRTLLAMSSSQDSCIAMRQSGCLPLLIQLLHGSDKDSALLGNTRGSKAARARAAAALHNIVHSHPDDKRGRREARVLRLLEQIRAHCDQLREMSSEEEEGGKDSVPLNAQMDHHPGYAIAALMKLSFDEEHRHAICTLGGLHAIAELLQVDHEVNRDTSEQYNITMRRYACMALTNLTFGDGTNKASLCSMKPAMRALVSQLFSSNEELCQVAASVLRNLSWKADLASKKTLREVEAVTSLMQGAMVVTKETTLKSILSALWNLSAHCSENKADICAVDGALVFLIVSLTYKSPSKTTAIIENGGGILRNVSSHIAVREDYRKCLRQHGCLQILLKHLRSPSLTIVSNACGTLWNLSARSAEDQQALWEMGAVSMLRNLVNSKHKMISMGSSAALKNLLAARPAMKNLELNKQGNMNRPSLHVRKQRALESEIDQNLSETCENVESPRDSPVESKKSDAGVFVYPVYSIQDGEHRRSLLRAGQVIPRSQSGGDNSLSLENQISNQQRVSRSGSQDSVGSTHSDISHDRSRVNMTNRTQVNMGGSLDRNKDTLQSPAKRHNSDGRCERNPLGPPNSRILQVMQEVAMHAGLEGQGSQNKGDTAVFKTPFPVPQGRVPHPQRQGAQSQQEGHHHPVMNPQQAANMYQMYMMQKSSKTEHSLHNNNQQENNDDEKPLDYSLKYRENNSQSESKDRKGHPQDAPPKQPLVGNFVRNPQKVFFDRHMMNNNRFHFNSEYAETDLDAPDQVTDFSARYGAEYQNRQYSVQRYNNYEDSDPNCADCKLEEARRYNDRLEQTMEHDQVTMFYTEDTPYLSTATSLTDLSTAAKILEEAQNQFSGNERDYNDGDEMQNFSSKYAEQDNGHGEDDVVEGKQQSQGQGHRYNETEHSSRSGSQTTDHCTGTTVIPNYNLSKADKYSTQSDSHSLAHSNDDLQERSFHNTCSEDAPDDQTKTYCEEGTPVCFSRVSSLSSLHSSEANDRQEKRPTGPLQSIKENEDFKNNSLVKVQQPSSVAQHSGRQKTDGMDSRDMQESAEKEHKTVTFDEKEHIQETPMMFSRCTSLGSLSSFDTQSVHSSVFSEYSRRASENVSPSELPDSPSESMPSSPGRVKSPDRYHEKKPSVRQELFPESLPPQFTNKAGGNVKRVHPLTAFMAMGKNIQIGSSNRQFDIESTSSCKSEAPVVYADEGTPPIFNDNLSTLSEITTDHYDINDKTLTENPGSGSNHSNRSTGSHEDANTTIYKTPIRKPPSDSDPNQKTQPNVSEQIKSADPTGGCFEQEKMAVVNTKPENDSKTDKCATDKGHSSNSDVSEGEDDLLANIISSAMPNSSKKIRKSSSDNAIKRKSSSSSKADSGSSSRSKTPAKTPIDSPAGKSGISKRVHQSSSNPGSQNETPLKDRTKVNPYGETNASGNKNKSMLPKPAASHRDVRRVLNEDPVSLNSSIDSTKSDTPFNMSNTLSIINRPIHEKPQSRTGSQNSNLLIMQKVENLKNYEDDGEDEAFKTYATEDTPFSGSIPASPRNERKFNGGSQPPVDLNQDSVTTFATEDTPFSGSIPASPRNERKFNGGGQPPVDLNQDSVTTFATEDTPFSGSIPASPRNERKFHGGGQPQVDLNQDSVTTFATEGTPFSGSMPGSPKANRASNFNYLDMEPDTVKCYNTEDTPFTGSAPESPKMARTERISQPGANQNQFKQMHSTPSHQASVKTTHSDTLRNANTLSFHQRRPLAIDTSEDTVRSYATEGTPYNQSNVPSPKPSDTKNPSRFNPAMLGNMDCIGNAFEASEDQLKTFATEGTPLNFSRTGSFSDLSSLNTNFEEKVKIDAVEESVNDHNLDDTHSDNSSLMEENEELLSEIIQSAMPAAKPGKTGRKSLDRKTDESEGKSNISFDSSSSKSKASKVPVKFQPQRTSSLAHDSALSNLLKMQNEDCDEDQVRTFAVEDTPNNASVKTSLSDLTVDSDSLSGMKTSSKNHLEAKKPSAGGLTGHGEGSNYTYPSLSAMYGTWNDSVFIQSDWGAGDSLQVFKTEGTPQTFSCNDSLSTLSMLDDDSKDEVSKHIASLAERITCGKEDTKDEAKSVIPEVKINDLERHVIGQSSEDQSLSIHSDDDDDPEDLALLEDCISSALPPPTRPNKSDRRRTSHGSKGEHVSRKTRSDRSTAKYSNNHHSTWRNCSSADELETSGTHDSRYTSWRQQPQKSCDEIFKRPTLDAKGRPCRRSRSQDSEHKLLKQYKDSSNKEIAQQYVGQVTKYGNGTGVYNSLPRDVYRDEEREEIEKQRQQIISESQNLTRSIEHQVRELENRTQKMGVGSGSGSGEKSDEHENEKNESPTSADNFFMTCSGMTEISVESISKQSMPSNMVPYDTDDDILESSLMGSRFGGDGDESNMLVSGHERTLTGSMSANSTLTDRSGTRFTQSNLPMDLSITSEDEKALAVNASIVVSEMAVNRMGASAYSNVEDDRFIEHETLSLVSNDYISDSGSENSITWSLSSERTSEYTESLASTECGSPQTRRPRILKPEDKAESVQTTDADLKAVRGKRKPLYHSKSVSSAPSTAMSVTSRPDQQSKGRNVPVHNSNKPTNQGGATNVVPKKATSTLRTQPQACSTPVKANPGHKPKTTKTTLSQRSSSLDQKSLNVKNTSAQRLANYSGEYSTPTKIPSKTSPRSKTEGGEARPKPKTLSKQRTFVKETTNRNAPVISPDEKANYNSNGRLRDNDGNSSGSSKSINSNNVSIGSEDSLRDQSYSAAQDSVSMETTPKKKDSKLRRSLGTSHLSNSKKNLQSPGTVGTMIPSLSKNNHNKTGTTANGKKTPGKPAPLLKTSSGSSLVKTNSGSNSSLKKLGSQQDVKKSGSNSSLRANSRPTTPVVKDAGKPSENGKKGAKKALTSKISSLLKKEEKPIKGKPVSKLPIAKSKKVIKEPTKRESSPRPAINRNTVILSEASLDLPVVDGISRSSTYDKLKATNEYSQIPSHDITNQSSSSENTNNESVDLDKTKKFDHEFEVGVEYSLDDAWASRVEKSIEAMSRSIEENNKQSKSAYGEHDIDISKMNFSDSPAKRLSKSGSMSEIELEFGRIHSGTWKKKKSHNDFALLPNADETSKTLPLVKRAESLNFNMGRSSECLSQYDSELEDVWIRRDDKMRMSDNSMTVKSKRKGFKGSSSFLPIKNVVSKVFGSKKSDKQSKSVTEFDKQSRSFVTEKELKKMNESNTKLNKKEKDLRMNKSEIIKPSKSELKAEAKISKAELKAEAKQIKAEAKQKKAEMKALKKGSKLQQSLEVKRREGESQNLNSSLTSLKKSAEDLIDIDESDDEDNGTPHLSLSKSAKNLRAPPQTTNNARRNSNNKVIDSGAIENGTLGKNESVFYSQAVDHQVTEKLSPNKSSSESLSSRSNQSPVLNRSAKQSPTSQHATKTEMLLARRQQILNSTSSQDRSDTEDENKRKCIVTTV